MLAATSIELDEGSRWVDELGLRYASSRSLGELLASASVAHPPHAEMLRLSHARINKMAESAMTLSLGGDPTGAVLGLIAAGRSTLNGKLADIAQQMLTRHHAKIDDPEVLREQVESLRKVCGAQPRRAALSQDRHRQPGGLSLRVPAPAVAVAAVKPAPPEPASTDELPETLEPVVQADLTEPAVPTAPIPVQA